MSVYEHPPFRLVAVDLLPEKLTGLYGLQVNVFKTDGHEYALLVK